MNTAQLVCGEETTPTTTTSRHEDDDSSMWWIPIQLNSHIQSNELLYFACKQRREKAARMKHTSLHSVNEDEERTLRVSPGFFR